MAFATDSLGVALTTRSMTHVFLHHSLRSVGDVRTHTSQQVVHRLIDGFIEIAGLDDM